MRTATINRYRLFFFFVLFFHGYDVYIHNTRHTCALPSMHAPIMMRTYRDTPLANCYRKCELQKKRSYEEPIREVEHGSFTPLILSTQGGMSKVTMTMYKCLASLISPKKSQPYSKTMNWIRCLIGFVPPQSNNHVPERSTLKCQSGCQK